MFFLKRVKSYYEHTTHQVYLLLSLGLFLNNLIEDGGFSRHR